MPPFRRLLDRSAAAALIVAAALVLRLLVPAGYMPALHDGRIALAICAGAMPPAPVAHAGMAHGDRHDAPGAPDEAPGSPCAFADLSLPLVGGADPVLLAAAILFAVALARALSASLPPRLARHLRPPSHAPPFPA